MQQVAESQALQERIFTNVSSGKNKGLPMSSSAVVLREKDAIITSYETAVDDLTEFNESIQLKFKEALANFRIMISRIGGGAGAGLALALTISSTLPASVPPAVFVLCGGGLVVAGGVLAAQLHKASEKIEGLVKKIIICFLIKTIKCAQSNRLLPPCFVSFCKSSLGKLVEEPKGRVNSGSKRKISEMN
jgi:hypothetical protein